MVGPARPGKRPLKALSCQEKLDAIDRIKNRGESKASVARDIGVPESTLRGWCKTEDKIRSLMNNSGASSPCATPEARRISAYEHSNSCSEDETVHNPAKRLRTDNGTNPQDYMELIKRLVVAGNMPPSQAAQFLTQLGLTAADLNDLLSNMTTAGKIAPPKTFGLVENGLVYTSSNKNTSLAASTPKSSWRQNVPLAAEAPAASIPASPERSRQRRVTETSSNADDSKSTSSESTSRVIDEHLHNWLSNNHQEFLGQVVAPFAPSTRPSAGSWFWQLYKQCDVSATQKEPELKGKNIPLKKSPSKAKAVIDLVLNCNNNNDKENVRKSLNLDGDDKQEDEDVKSMTFDEALEHAEKFTKWLEQCHEPSVTHVHITRMRSMVDAMKKQKTASKHCKRSRK